MITEKLISDAYRAGMIIIQDSSDGDGVVCKFGGMEYYFWDSQDGKVITAKELVNKASEAEIVHAIWMALDDLRHKASFVDECDNIERVLFESSCLCE